VTAHPEKPTRIAFVDALRGFALFGILVVNIQFFASSFHGSGIDDPAHTGTLGDSAGLLVKVLFETKFYLLFSFLFGYSFTLWLAGAERRGEPVAAQFSRRMLFLIIVGTLHAVLLFPGDILATYGLVGFALLRIRHWQSRKAFRFGMGVLVATAGIYGLLGLASLLAGEGAPGPGSIAADSLEAMRAYGGDPLDVISQNTSDLGEAYALLLFFQAPSALAMFAVGYAAGRLGILRNPEDYRWLWKRGALLLPVGLAGGVIYAWGSTEPALHAPAREILAVACDVLLAPVLSFSWLSLVLLLCLSKQGPRVVGILAPAGRLALTNYLLQSVFLCLLFTGYGLALIGEVSPAGALAVAIGIYCAQLAGSALYLRRGPRYGPVEALLRAATRWTRPTTRVQS